MAEPNTTGASIAALFISVLGPFAGQYSLIIFAALAGALWPLSTMPELTRKTGAFFLFRIVATAVVITGSVAWFFADRYQIPIHHGMAVVAFMIGALGNGWAPIFKALREGIAALARSLGGANKGGE